jgi:polar amino acid transport system substrate-binding protein
MGGLHHQPQKTVSGARLLLTAGLVLACAVSASQAREALPLVTGNGYSPFAGSELPGGGLTTALVRRVFQGMDRPVEIAFEPWPRGYRATLDGEFDATFPYLHTPERAEDFHYSDPLLTVHLRVFVRADASVDKLADLTGQTLCVPLGYAITRDIREMLAHLDYEEGEPRTMTQCMRMLGRGRVDFVAITRRHAQSLLAEVPLEREGLRMLEDVDVSADLHLIVPKQRDGARQLLEDFNRTLARLREQGEVRPHPDSSSR